MVSTKLSTLYKNKINWNNGWNVEMKSKWRFGGVFKTHVPGCFFFSRLCWVSERPSRRQVNKSKHISYPTAHQHRMQQKGQAFKLKCLLILTRSCNIAYVGGWVRMIQLCSICNEMIMIRKLKRDDNNWWWCWLIQLVMVHGCSEGWSIELTRSYLPRSYCQWNEIMFKWYHDGED